MQFKKAVWNVTCEYNSRKPGFVYKSGYYDWLLRLLKCSVWLMIFVASEEETKIH